MHQFKFRMFLVLIIFLVASLGEVTRAAAANEVYLSNDADQSEVTYFLNVQTLANGAVRRFRITLPPGTNAANARLGRFLVGSTDLSTTGTLTVDPLDPNTVNADLGSQLNLRNLTNRIEILNLTNPTQGSYAIDVRTLNNSNTVVEVIPPIAYSVFEVGPGDITAVNAGTGLTGGGTSGDVTLSVNTSQIQSRVVGSCPAGSSIRQIDATGNVVCEIDDNSGGTVTSVGTNSGLVGGPITTTGTIGIALGGVTSAHIADGTVGSVDVNSAQIQLRVTGNCTTGNAIRVVNADGTVTCEPAGGITGSGTTNTVPKFTGATAVGNSQIFDNGTNVGVGTVTPGAKLDVAGTVNTNTQYNIGGSRVVAVQGISNVFLGVSAGQSNTTGINNTAVGGFALLTTSIGNNNTAVGAAALEFNNNGSRNTATGADALINNQSGSDNTAAGQSALVANQTGNSNTAVGRRALDNNLTGSNNTAIGTFAGTNATGSNNIYISNPGVAAESNAIRIGTQGTQNSTFVAGINGTNLVGSPVVVDSNGQLGTGATSSDVAGTTNTVIKFTSATTGGDSQIFDNGTSVGVGTTTPGAKLDVAGAVNTSTQYNIGGSRVVSAPGSQNIFVGVAAGQSNTTGVQNTALGDSALFSNTGGNNNTATGVTALSRNTTGANNTAIGVQALLSNTTGFQNTATGVSALNANTTGSTNTATGVQALATNTTGDSNTATGANALLFNTTGSNNTALGYGAGINATTGSDNIYVNNSGVVDESNTIRIGTQGTQTSTFIAGINGTNLVGNPVVVDSNGQLGVGAGAHIENGITTSESSLLKSLVIPANDTSFQSLFYIPFDVTAVAIAEVTVTARNPANGSMQWAYKKIFKAGRNANGTISYRGSETIFSDSGASSGDLGADPVFDAVQMHVKIKSNGFNGDLHVSGVAKVFIATSNP